MRNSPRIIYGAPGEAGPTSGRSFIDETPSKRDEGKKSLRSRRISDKRTTDETL
jgi:hypothetical protein